MKVLRCKLPFIWFDKNGLAVVKYFESHLAVAMPWTHEIDCAITLHVDLSAMFWKSSNCSDAFDP